jgi:hypothetical protein
VLSVRDAPEDRLLLGAGADESCDHCPARVGVSDASRQDTCCCQHDLCQRLSMIVNNLHRAAPPRRSILSFGA